MTLSEHDGLPDVPSGTVTFLFTDIEGSTRLLEQLRDGYALVLADQRDLLRAAFGHHGGHEIDTQGDAFFAVFPRAVDALNCVIEAQQALAKHAWPGGAVVRVRMGLHTGEPIVGRTGYVGMDVHRAARIAAAGHGGQVLLSQTTRDLIYQDLPVGASLLALGEHKLKDIRFPQPLYQLDIAGLPSQFAALKTLANDDEPPAPGPPPFKGLPYFDEADADWFFGRDQVVAGLLERFCGEPFLAVIGASGSGKSSILRAGLLAALRGAGRLRGRLPARCAGAEWRIHLLTPTARPLEALALSLAAETESVTAAATLIDDMRRDARSLHLWVRRFMGQPVFSRPAPGDARLLLAIDQFEELFTLCRDPDERQAFVDNLMLLVTAAGGAASVILTLRADFYQHLAPYPALSEAVAQHQVYIGAMKHDELRQAIEAPVSQGGWEFSPGLVELLLHDVGADPGRLPEPGALPLLSHALLETWKRRRGHRMPLKAYAESGGVRGAIARTAEGVFYQELTPAQQAIARNIFLRLTELGEGAQDTRRRVSTAELLPLAAPDQAAQVEEVLARLADARLITTGEGTVEVAHEALIREWPTLRGWLDADREGLRLHRHLTEAAQAWSLRGRDPAELYRGTRLGQVLEWAAGHDGDLNALEREFLEAARGLVEREAAEREAAQQRELAAARQLAETQSRAARQLRRRALYLLGALVVALAAALAAGLFARQANQNAAASGQSLSTAQAAAQGEAQARATEQALARANAVRDEAQRLAGASSNVLASGGSSELVGLLALRSMALQYTPQGDTALLAAAALDYPLRLLSIGAGSAASPFEIEFSPDGRYVSASSWDPGQVDQAVTIWDSQSGQRVRTMELQNYGQAAFSPDSAWLAICWGDLLASTTGTLQVSEVSTGRILQHITTGACGAPPQWQDQHTLLLGGLDGAVRSFDVTTGRQLNSWAIVGAALNLSRRGKYALVTPDLLGGDLGGERELDLWDLGAARLSLALTNTEGIWGTAFSPDESLVAVGLGDNTIQVWQTAAGQPVATLKGHAALVGSLAFSGDGQYLLSGSDDRTAQLWRTDSWQAVRRWSGSATSVGGVQFSPDGRSIAIGTRLDIALGGDGTARLWSLQPQPEWPALAGQAGPQVGVAFSPDGRVVAIAGTDGVARLWDLHSGQATRTFFGTDALTFGPRFSPDGSRLLAGAAGGAATLWDVASGSPVIQAQPKEMVSLDDAAFAPDGASFVVVGSSNLSGETYAIVIDAHTGDELRRLTVTGANHATAVDYSPDGRYIGLATVDGSAWLGDAHTGQIVRQLAGHVGAITSLRFSPDSRYLATAGADKTARLWDVATGQEVRHFVGHTQAIALAAFSPDGQSLATASHDGTLRVWDVATGQELRRYAADPIAVEDVAWSPDGQLLASVGRATTARLWDVDDHTTIAYLCGRLQRDLTDAERAQYDIADTTPTCGK